MEEEEEEEEGAGGPNWDSNGTVSTVEQDTRTWDLLTGISGKLLGLSMIYCEFIDAYDTIICVSQLHICAASFPLSATKLCPCRI